MSRTLFRPGATLTPKQLQLDAKNRKLYWSDREGMRVMRANLDGSNIETLRRDQDMAMHDRLDARNWCVGIARRCRTAANFIGRRKVK